jgi:hypothetical protein
MLTRKLKGGALYIAVFLSLVIAVLLSMIILMSYYHIIDYDNFLIEDKVQSNAMSALNYCIASAEEIPEPKIVDLYENGDDSVSMKVRWWGCYRSVAVEAFRKGYEVHYNCLVGSGMPRDTCLITPGKSKPVSVSGRTEFTGICLLPKQGIKTAYVDGQNYIGDRPVHGSILAISQLPEADKGFMDRTESLLYNYSSLADSLLGMDQFLEKDSISNSFLQKTLLVHSDGVILLANKTISGNVLIHSSRKIIVEASCVTKDILLVAPKIEIRQKFKGSLQAFASDTLKTEKDVELMYPSSLVVFARDNKTEKKQPSLFIDENNRIKGQLIVINNSTNIDRTAYLRLSKESVLEGSLYCNGYLDLQAAVKGLVMTNSFLLVTPSSVYENHVLNATINRKELSDHFSAGMIFGSKRKKSIAKWVN